VAGKLVARAGQRVSRPRAGDCERDLRIKEVELEGSVRWRALAAPGRAGARVRAGRAHSLKKIAVDVFERERS